MTLVRIEFKSMKVREVFRSKDVRNSLETVRAEIQIFEILQILEVRVKFSKSVSTDCKSLEVSELRDMLSGAETAKEMIGIGINYNFLSSSKILNLERNFLDGLEHKELYRSYTSLVRTVLPHRHIGPMLHSFRCLPLCEHIQATAYCKQGKRVTGRSSDRNRKSRLLNHLQSIMSAHLYILGRFKHDICNSLYVTGIDLPVEAYLGYTRSGSSVKGQIGLFIRQPFIRSFRKNYIEIHVGSYIHFKISGLVSRIIRYIYLRLIEDDLIFKSILNDCKVSFFLSIKILDTH